MPSLYGTYLVLSLFVIFGCTIACLPDNYNFTKPEPGAIDLDADKFSPFEPNNSSQTGQR